MFVNPGGPGERGVSSSRPAGDFDAWGGGLFDIVGLGSPAHTRQLTGGLLHQHPRPGQVLARCDHSHHHRRVGAFQRKTVEVARRCGRSTGSPEPHLDADTARDLVRWQAVGDRPLTYVGLSYGTAIGQTYANLFPDRVRAMMLDGLVDAVICTTSAETRTASDVASTDEVFDQFVDSASGLGPPCALAGHGETVAQRVAPVRPGRRSPIPAPKAEPPGQLGYGDPLASTSLHPAAAAQLARVRSGSRGRGRR